MLVVIEAPIVRSGASTGLGAVELGNLTGDSSLLHQGTHGSTYPRHPLAQTKGLM